MYSARARTQQPKGGSNLEYIHRFDSHLTKGFEISGGQSLTLLQCIAVMKKQNKIILLKRDKRLCTNHN